MITLAPKENDDNLHVVEEIAALGSRSVAIMVTLGEAITSIMRSRAAIILAIISFCWQLWSQIMRTAWQLWEKIYSFRVQLQELADNYRVQLSENLPNYEKHFTITGYDKGTVFYSSTPWLRLWKISFRNFLLLRFKVLDRMSLFLQVNSNEAHVQL